MAAVGIGPSALAFAALLKEELGLFWEKIAGLTAWPRVAVTPRIALERIAPSRGGEVAEELPGADLAGPLRRDGRVRAARCARRSSGFSPASPRRSRARAR